MWQKTKLSWLAYALISLFLGWYVLKAAQVQQAGDIVEYYGITQSVINHGSLELTGEDRSQLEQVLHKAYFQIPGYYLTGTDGQRYPVHFWFYSLLAVPVRLILAFTEFDPRRSLLAVNWLSVVLAVGFIMKRYGKNQSQQLALLTMVFTGSLMSFLVWPGPDLWYLSLLLIVPFAFFAGEFWLAAVLAVFASWHSQPLLVLAFGLTGYAAYQSWLSFSARQRQVKTLGLASALAGAGLLALIPYFYNLSVFGTLTPWTRLPDGWTLLRGFGLHNASLWKLYEQWFDLNIGLFWYAPAVFLLGVLGMCKLRAQRQKLWFFAALSLLTAFFYQTNPAWHYGTVGFGPGRHAVYLLPLLIYFAVQAVSAHTRKSLLLLILAGLTQLWGLSLNGFLEPDFTQTLDQSPYAKYVLARWPQYYSPTPEIFSDRTNHTDLDYPTSAIYKIDGRCVKAYVLLTDREELEKECGALGWEYHSLFDDPYLRSANYERTLVTKEAVFRPYPDACTDWFRKNEQQPFECLSEREIFLQKIGLTDPSRLAEVSEDGALGSWEVSWGEPVTLMVPPGYTVEYYAMDGVYVDYTLQK